ncbi:MAG: hypothetical protein IKW51_05845 [Bacteroidales bacterium]|nr:hypothetical protein [Bacteroidales bacterium]
MNNYYLKARLYPTILTMIPLVVLYIYYLSPSVDAVLSPVWDLLPIFTGVAINVCLMFLFVLLNRFVSKAVFQKLFYQDDLKMPTTDYLMPDHPLLDNSSRKRYYQYIMIDFNVNMSKELKQLETETQKRIMIARIVGQIRTKLKGNKKLLQHNIEYGFFRNFVGGCLIALLTSIALLIVSICGHNYNITMTSIIMIVIYLLPIIFSKQLITFHGKNYASVLFEQYGSLDR